MSADLALRAYRVVLAALVCGVAGVACAPATPSPDLDAASSEPTTQAPDLALARLFGCLLREGLDGQARTDPVLLPGNYHLTLEAPDAGGDPVRAEELITTGLAHCEAKYHDVLASHRADQDQALLRGRQEEAARRCLRQSAPRLAARAPNRADLEALRRWAHQQAAYSPAGERAAECVTGFGLPWRPLSRLAE